MSAADILPFFRAWVRNPLGVAAVAPSGPAISSLMVQEIMADAGPVIELGPGTGVFTRALLKRGVRQQDLTLVEYGSEFIPLLQRRFPAPGCSGWTRPGCGGRGCSKGRRSAPS